eukprot:1222110-Pyramimonas_sp.AAC.1
MPTVQWAGQRLTPACRTEVTGIDARVVAWPLRQRPGSAGLHSPAPPLQAHVRARAPRSHGLFPCALVPLCPCALVPLCMSVCSRLLDFTRAPRSTGAAQNAADTLRRISSKLPCCLIATSRRSVAAARPQVPRSNPVSFFLRMLLGSTAGFYYTLVPIYMWIKNLIFPKSWAI